MANAAGLCRAVLCVDADYFYAQVELLGREELRCEPVGVVQQHIVVTCNYVARERGVKKLMRTSDALRECPELRLFDGSDLAKYRKVHEEMERTIRDFFAARTKHVISVERQGLDEFFMELSPVVAERLQAGQGSHCFSGHVSGNQNDEYDNITRPMMVASQICAELRSEILSQTGLTCSGGVGTTRMAAKWATNIKKPNGQTTLLPDGVNDKLTYCPVRAIPGVGSKLERQLAERGVSTVADLQSKYTLSELQHIFGPASGKLLFDRARGLDNSVVQDHGELQVITVEEAAKGISSTSLLRQLLRKLANQLVPRLVANFVSTKRTPSTLTVKFRYKAGEVHRKSTTAPAALAQLGRMKNFDMRAVDVLVDVGMKLLVSLLPRAFVLSLVGIGITGFTSEKKQKTKTTIKSFFGGG